MVQRNVGEVFGEVICRGVLAREGIIGAGVRDGAGGAVAEETHGSVGELVGQDGGLGQNNAGVG